jgi:uncharacterized protein YjbJ (UPF0337 family)
VELKSLPSIGLRSRFTCFGVPASRAEALIKKGHAMDKDRIKGAGHQVKGGIKEAAGKLTGDTKTEAEGKAEKTAGKVQNTVGGVKDTLRGK